MGEYPHAISGLISPPLFWMVKEVGIHYQAVTRLGICCCQTAEVDSPASPIKWVVYGRGGSFATMRSVIRVCWRASPFLSHAPGQIFSHFRLELVYPCTTITPTPPTSIPLFLNQCFHSNLFGPHAIVLYHTEYHKGKRQIFIKLSMQNHEFLFITQQEKITWDAWLKTTNFW